MTRTTSDGRKAAPAFLALAAVGFIASAPAHAADPADPVAGAASDQRDDVVIEGERVRERENPKATQPLVNTPRSVVLISEDVIKDTGSATFVDALRTVPGITFGAAEGGNPIGDRPFIRGYDTQGSTFLDGVRDVGAQSREVFAVEQIEVVRGSDSTTGGRGSAGGAINIISKLPRGRTFASAALSYGTDDYKRVTLDANYRVSELIAVRLNAVYHDQDVAGRDFLYNERWGVAPSITIGVDSPTQLTASFYHLETDELPDSGFPYRYIASASVNNAPTTGLVISEPAIGDFTTASGTKGYIDPDNFYGLVNRDFRKTKVDQAMLRAQHDFGGVTLRNTARYSRTEQSYIYTQPDDSQANAFGIPTAGRNVGTLPSGRFNDYTAGGRVWRRANSRYGTVESVINQLDLFGKFETGPLKHNFAVGGELSWDRAARGTFVSQGGAAINTGTNNATTGGRCGTAPGTAPYNCADLFNPNPLDPWVNLIGGVATPIVRSAPETQTIQHGETKALYAFDSIEFGPAILNLGVRYDDFRSRVRLPVAAGIRPEVTRQDGVWNYQAGLVIKPTANISLYGSFATASTPPNSLMGEGQEGNALPTTGTLQAAADALAVENTKSYELGAKAQLFGGRLALSAAVFRTETDNARVTSDQGNIAFIGKRRVDGIELSVNGQILPGWQVFGGYTYLDAVVVDGGFTAFALPAGGGALARTVLQPSVNTGRRFPNTPEHAATLWTTVNVTPRFTIGGGAYYQGRVYGGYSDNRYIAPATTGVPAAVVPATVVIARSVPGYTRFDATASYRFTDKLELRVNVQNLTDKRYFATAYSSHYAQIAPGRSAFATLTIKY